MIPLSLFTYGFYVNICIYPQGTYELWSKRLLCVIDRSAFPYQIYLDLSGVFDLIFDLDCDIMCNDLHTLVVNFFGLDHYADFSARLNGVCFIDTLKACGNLLKLLQAFDIVFKVFASCTGSCRRDSICRLYDNGDDSLGFNVVVMCFDRMNNILAFLILTCRLNAYLDV